MHQPHYHIPDDHGWAYNSTLDDLSGYQQYVFKLCTHDDCADEPYYILTGDEFDDVYADAIRYREHLNNDGINVRAYDVFPDGTSADDDDPAPGDRQ